MTPEFHIALARWRAAQDQSFALMPRNGTITTVEEMTRWGGARDREHQLRAELDRIVRGDR